MVAAHTRYLSRVDTTLHALLFMVVLQRIYTLVDYLKICHNSEVLIVKKFHHKVCPNVYIGVSFYL